MTTVLISFYSRNGTTEQLALAVAEGARAAGADVRLRRARELVGAEVMQAVPNWAENAARMNQAYAAPTNDDVLWADAIVLGTPTRFGSMTSELKAWIDGLGGLWFQGKLAGKAGSAFGTTQSPHGGNESTILSIYNVFAHLGLIIVPTGYTDPVMFKAGTPYGASAATGKTPSVTDDERAVARYQGMRVTKVAAALKTAGLVTTG